MGEKGMVRCRCERDAHESEPPVLLIAPSHIDVGRFIPKVLSLTPLVEFVGGIGLKRTATEMCTLSHEWPSL